MPEEIPSTEPADTTPAPESAPADAAPKATEREDELPDWARQKLTKANAEAANYRTRLREAEVKLANAKSVEEFEAAVSEMKARNAELEHSILRADVAREFGLDAELTDALKGATEAELKEHAKRLQKYVPATTPDPATLSGGLDPTNEDDNFDPVKAARAARARRW